VRIALRKLTDARHELAILRASGAREAVECETRSYLHHDLLHYAVEREAGLSVGFWGTLAAGATLARMNDRTQPPPTAAPEQLMAIEQVVGALSETLKGRAPAELVAGMRRFAASMGTTMPDWLTEALVVGVNERMRRLLGRWRATPRGGEMVLDWPDVHRPLA
jgi:hypothetical protein